MTANLTQTQAGDWCLEGDLLMHDAPQIMRRALKIVRHDVALRLDLSGVLRFDSSIFALLLSIFREAEQHRGEFRVVALPRGFLARADIHGCRELMLQLCNANPPAWSARLTEHER